MLLLCCHGSALVPRDGAQCSLDHGATPVSLLKEDKVKIGEKWDTR
jgi:hypothetical protein